MDPLYFEDFSVGDRFVSQGVTFTESDIVNFALHYDPQSFHIDTRAAEASHFGGLIASGFHTLALSFRMFLQQGVLSACGMGSPGIDELRWLAPVRPGDTLHSEVEVLEVWDSTSKPDRGYMRLSFAAINQHAETVMTLICIQIVKRRIVQV